MSDFQFYETHLKKVSRSFSYCIAQLNSPLKEWVGASYLLCRALDSFEDEVNLSKDQKLDLMHQLSREVERSTDSLSLYPLNSDLSSYAISQSLLSLGLKKISNEHERSLLIELPILLERVKKFPDKVRCILRDLIETMSFGMSFFVKRTPEQQVIDAESQGLSTMQLNQYCYYVAGVVGEALTHLLAVQHPHFLTEANLKKARHFGLFLQKVNILKDQYKDALEGRFFIKNRVEVLKSLSKHSFVAIEYIKAIPNGERPFKVFCAISLALGLMTIPLLYSQTAVDLEPKLDKNTALKLFSSIGQSSLTDSEIDWFYSKAVRQIAQIDTDWSPPKEILKRSIFNILEENFYLPSHPGFKS